MNESTKNNVVTDWYEDNDDRRSALYAAVYHAEIARYSNDTATYKMLASDVQALSSFFRPWLYDNEIQTTIQNAMDQARVSHARIEATKDL